MAVAFASLMLGILFAIGLLVSGMTNPANIKGFLDLFGAWRPQLAAVMGAGVLLTYAMYAIARRRNVPMVESAFHWPDVVVIDTPLIAGAALFGAGWAIAGYCPGPAIVAAGALKLEAIVFVVAMLAGGYAHRLWKK
jgi:uncharacterized membrane protein YedE/YeeE